MTKNGDYLIKQISVTGVLLEDKNLIDCLENAIEDKDYAMELPGDTPAVKLEKKRKMRSSRIARDRKCKKLLIHRIAEDQLDYVQDNALKNAFQSVEIAGQLKKESEKKDQIDNYIPTIIHTTIKIHSSKIEDGTIFIQNNKFICIMETISNTEVILLITETKTNLQFDDILNVSHSFQIVNDHLPIPTDGILGRDFFGNI